MFSNCSFIKIVASVIFFSLVISGGEISIGKFFHLKLEPIGKGIAWLGKGVAIFRNSCCSENKEGLPQKRDSKVS